MVGHLPCLSNCLVWWKCMVLEQMLEVWLVILDMKASQHAAFKQRFSAHNRSAVAVQTLPLIVLTSDPSSYDIGTVCSTVWKIIALLQFLWAHLKRSHLSGRLRPWLCFFAVRKNHVYVYGWLFLANWKALTQKVQILVGSAMLVYTDVLLWSFCWKYWYVSLDKCILPKLEH